MNEAFDSSCLSIGATDSEIITVCNKSVYSMTKVFVLSLVQDWLTSVHNIVTVIVFHSWSLP